MAHFEIKDLSFSYPGEETSLALKHIDLSIERGQYVTICGRSGSGKTTLLRHFKTVLAPHGRRSGSILFDGRPLEEVDMREQSAKIGYVMQNPDDQIVTDKVWHELAFGLESLGTDQKTMRLRVAEMASYFGIQDWFHKNVAELSGGQKQLLNLASIMAMQPDALVLDEPTSQLDPIAAADFLNTVRKINLELGMTIIITEHRLEDILHVSDMVVVMKNGEIEACDEPAGVGRILNDSDREMFAAMPTPVQVYYGTGGAGRCPLTVREGRNWLSRELKGRELKLTRIEPHREIPEDEKKAVLLKEVWFRYEKNTPDVLKGVTLGVPASRIFALMGGNGTGKTTMLKTLCGICRPYRGKVKVNGKVAMLPQDPRNIFVKKTVRDELLEMIPRNAEEREQKAMNAAEICQVTELLDSHPYDLSGGEQQRAALAKVLVTEPDILLLDEPTKGIDSFFKIRIAGIMKELTERGVTVIMVSHDVEFCAAHADLVGMFFDGSVITVDTPDSFFSHNSFYTTAANRMSRHIFENAITSEDVIELCRINR